MQLEQCHVRLKPKFKLKLETLKNENVQIATQRYLTACVNHIPPNETKQQAVQRCLGTIQTLRQQLQKKQKQIINDRVLNTKLLAEQCADESLSMAVRDRASAKLQQLQKEKNDYMLSKLRLERDITQDGPSKPLSSLLAQRAAERSLPFVTDPKDPNTRYHAPADIVNTFQTFYQNLYNQPNIEPDSLFGNLHLWRKPSREVSARLNDVIAEPFSIDLIEHTIQHLPKNKAAGPDGLTAELLQLHPRLWATLFLPMFNAFLQGEEVPASLSEGIITTIWKKQGDHTNLHNRRPITLLNTVYKLYNRLIADRLLPVMEPLISPHQVGFMRGRSIYDPIESLAAIIHHVRLPDVAPQFKQAFIIMLDLEKAFDKVAREAIWAIFRHLGMSPTSLQAFINIFKNCTSRISVNGLISDPISLHRGVQQGNPLSPLLFNFAIELLSNLVRSNFILRGLPHLYNASPSQYTSIRLYADGVVLMGCGQLELDYAIRTLDAFCKATACKVNPNKTKILYPNLLKPPDALICGFQQVDPKTGEKFLGFYFNKKGIINKMQDRINKLINILINFKRLHFTLLARVNIYRTYVLSKIIYFLRFETPSAAQISTFQNAINWFLFDHSKTMNQDKTYRARLNASRAAAKSTVGGIQLLSFADYVTCHTATPAVDIVTQKQTAWAQQAIEYLRRYKPHYDFTNLAANPPKINWPRLNAALHALHRVCGKIQGISLEHFQLISPLKLLCGAFISTNPVLTPSQIRSQQHYNLNWNANWRKFRKLKLPSNIKSFLFKALNNISTWQIAHECHCGLQVDSFWHLFTCSSLRSTKILINRLLVLWTGAIPHFSKRETISIHTNPKQTYISTIATWTLWNVRNKLLFENRPPSDNVTTSFLKAIFTRLIRLHFFTLSRPKFEKLWISAQHRVVTISDADSLVINFP